jgi:hypothetical protein
VTTVSKQYLRKAAVAARYGITTRSVERKVSEGTLPPPEYPVGRIPLWSEEVLEQNERRSITDQRVTADAATATAAA